MVFPEAKLKALEEKISHPRWVVPVLPEQELEALLIAATDLAGKGKYTEIKVMSSDVLLKIHF